MNRGVTDICQYPGYSVPSGSERAGMSSDKGLFDTKMIHNIIFVNFNANNQMIANSVESRSRLLEGDFKVSLFFV